MTKNILQRSAFAVVMGLGFAACNPEPDESNLYTATGDTIESFIQKDSTLTSFNYILGRVGLDRLMASYGQYTCYAPTNDAVAWYIDSLYNDTEALVPHNSMTENSLEGLSDSLCNDIARFHLTNSLNDVIKMSAKITINSMLGRPIATDVNSSGRIVLGTDKTAEIISEDNQVVNGIVHVINQVIRRSTRLLPDEMAKRSEYSIFNEALVKTGLCDSLLKSKKDHEWTADEMGDHSDTNGASLYWPNECKIGYTIFAESNEVLSHNGINSFEDLVRKANEWYADADGWYDNLREKGLWNYDTQRYETTVSTGRDFHNRNNALNMFVAYHILYASMAQDQMVFENVPGVSPSTSKWNYVNGGEPYDYYETMLPNTLLKIWEPQPGKTLYINRYQTFNTLTNEVGTMGTNHELIRPGIRIDRVDIEGYNGYIHPIQGMLVYDELVPKGVLFERLRFESTTFLPEFINNGFRNSSQSEISAKNGGGSGARIAFPRDYFDNVVSYTDQNQLRYNVKGDFRSYQADAFQGWGKYDLAIKMPHVPSGLYEFRLFYSPMAHGGFMQFYMGTSSNAQTMEALGIPLDVRIQEDDPRIGWTRFYEEDDLGIATDEAMRNRGYMRAPCSFRGHPDGTGDMKSNNCRGDGVVTLRRILCRMDFKQSKDYWFRIKSVISDDDLKWQLDFVEFVPVSIVDNAEFAEDWY